MKFSAHLARCNNSASKADEVMHAATGIVTAVAGLLQAAQAWHDIFYPEDEGQSQSQTAAEW